MLGITGCFPVETYDEYRQIINIAYSPCVSTFKNGIIPSGVELQELIIPPWNISDKNAENTFLTVLIDNEVLFSGIVPKNGFKIDIFDTFSSLKSTPLPRRITVFVTPESEVEEILENPREYPVSQKILGDVSATLSLNFIGMWRHPVIESAFSNYDQRFTIENL
jgi:hypothetical protein